MVATRFTLIELSISKVSVWWDFCNVKRCNRVLSNADYYSENGNYYDPNDQKC